MPSWVYLFLFSAWTWLAAEKASAHVSGIHRHMGGQSANCISFRRQTSFADKSLTQILDLKFLKCYCVVYSYAVLSSCLIDVSLNCLQTETFQINILLKFNIFYSFSSEWAARNTQRRYKSVKNPGIMLLLDSKKINKKNPNTFYVCDNAILQYVLDN